MQTEARKAMDISSGSGFNGLGGNAAAPVLIKDADESTFMQDVIEASKETVVLVDFWAPWCGPCKTLGPLLEKLVTQAGGAVRMVKVDIDKNQNIATQLNIRSVPTVYAFKDGQPFDGFQGALPESQLKEFIKRVGGGGAMEQVEAAMTQAAESFQQGDLNTAASIYSQIAQAMPDNIEAVAGLARCLLASGNPDAAREAIAQIPEDQQSHPSVRSVLTALELAGDAGSTDDDELSGLQAKVDANPDDDNARFELAKAMSGKGLHQEAADALLIILEKDLDWNEGAAKEQLLKIFEAAGPKAEVTRVGRRRLSSLLFN